MRLQRLTDLSDAPDAESFEQQLITLMHDMDFGLVTAMMVTELPDAPAHVIRIGNTPPAFLEAFKNVESSARDPVLRRFKALSVPFIYDQGTYVSEDASDLWEEQAPFGYKTGIGVALHLQGRKHFVLSFDRERALPKSETKLVRMLADLQLLAVHAQSAASRIFTLPQAVSLTPKEQTILRLTMEGKSAKVIGSMIFCAEATVNFHLVNIRNKFGVTSKHKAVQLAQAAGLI